MKRDAFLIAIVISTNAAGAIVGQGPPAVTFRATGALPSAIQEVLSRLAEPAHVKVPAGVQPDNVVRQFCGGSITNDYLEQVRESNSGYQRSVKSVDRVLSLPPCARSETLDQTITVGESTTAESLTRQAFGVSPMTVITLCEGKAPAPYTNCNLPAIEALRQLNRGRSTWLEELRTGQKIGIPRLTAFTTVRVKKGVDPVKAAQEIGAVADKIAKETGSQPLSGLGASGELGLVPLVSDNEPKLKNTSCEPGRPIPAHWPFHADRLKAAIELTRKEAATRKVTIKPSVIRVADTGGTGLGSYFPEKALSVNPNIADGMAQGGKGRYGFDADQKGDVQPFHGDPYALHGTQVADFALGGSLFRKSYEPVYDLVQITFIKIFKKEGGGGITVHDGTLYQSMERINEYEDAAVVNFSVGAPSDKYTMQFEKQVLQSRIGSAPLAVVAAGNIGENLSNVASYPAAYGGTGDAANWMIVVGGSSPDPGWATYSNYSRDVVDILAPGCQLSFKAPDDKQSVLHGTSLAAPQVSFVAAVLRTLTRRGMNEVKIRIIAASDFHPDLVTRSRYGTILNPSRALMPYHDVLALADDDEDRPGKWERDPLFKICKDRDDILVTNVLSVTSYLIRPDERKLRVLYLAQGRLAEPVDCVPGDMKLKFKDVKGRASELGWDKVKALVPAQKGLPVVPSS